MVESVLAVELELLAAVAVRAGGYRNREKKTVLWGWAVGPLSHVWVRVSVLFASAACVVARPSHAERRPERLLFPGHDKQKQRFVSINDAFSGHNTFPSGSWCCKPIFERPLSKKTEQTRWNQEKKTTQVTERIESRAFGFFLYKQCGLTSFSSLSLAAISIRFPCHKLVCCIFQ
jgi:hypothetical protein